MKNVLIIGGSGFLGSALVKRLIKNIEYKVKIFDLLDRPELCEVDYIKGDICNLELLDSALIGVDIVYNFAAISDLYACDLNPKRALNINIIGNWDILELCIKNKVERFVFSSSLYADSNNGGIYSITKFTSEKLIKYYCEKNNINFSILRIGTIYGPEADDNNSVTRYIKSAINYGRIDCKGDGNEVRSYLHVNDAAAICEEILNEEYKNKTLILEGVNFYKVADLFNIISEVLNKEILINYLNTNDSLNYKYTPYNISESFNEKVILNSYIDFNQGLFQLIKKYYNENSNQYTNKEK